MMMTTTTTTMMNTRLPSTRGDKDNEEEEERSAASGSDLDQSSSNASSRNPNGGSTSTGDTPSEGMSGADPIAKGQLARRETENVNRLRYLVLTILFLAAAGVSVLVYLVSKSSEDDEMETQFDAASTRLVDAFEGIRTERIATLASLAVAAIAHGVDHSRDWPFVSLSSYQQRAYTAKQNSGTLQVSIAPWVTQENRDLWEEYIVSNEAEVDWIERSLTYQDEVGSSSFIKDYGENFRGNVNVSHSIKVRNPYTGEVEYLPGNEKDAYLPFWEMSPFLSFDEVNVDMLRGEEDLRGFYGALSISEGAIVIGDMTFHTPGGIDSDDPITSAYAQLLSIDAGKEVKYQGDPMTYLFIPIFDSFEDGRVPKAVLVGFFNWGNLFKDVLPENTRGIDLVLRNTCFEPYTFRVIGEDVKPRGKGDLHETEFNGWEVETPVLESGRTADGTKDGLGFVERDCTYSMSIYPSKVFADEYRTSTPWILVSAVSCVLLFAIIMFFVYDHLVERRQSLVLRKAVQSTAIVSSLFPKTVRDRLMNVSSINPGDNDAKTLSAFRDRLRNRSKLPDNKGQEEPKGDLQLFTDNEEETIADLFPNCTVLFADIAGFTAWSSTRDPSQVFTLLQNLYQAFDRVAMRRRVFKVETIGDSYVAVTGLPEPQADHAVIMAKFARDCLQKMHEVTSFLEVRLGPDTNDLSMRLGLNSGQVTGGVLRGDRARFQLFGDTVNTAARMESTGERGRIQLSQATADLLLAAGKERWIRPREDVVTAKGKGAMNTFWLEIDGPRQPSSVTGKHVSEDSRADLAVPQDERLMYSSGFAAKQETRLMGWMTEVLLDYVKQIVAKNKATRGGQPRSSAVAHRYSSDSICLDEIVQSFALPRENATQVSMAMEQYRSVELDPSVGQQLRLYVAEIASRYHETNPFHNFAHACHVTMSVHKLMKRVVSDGTDELATGTPTLGEKHSATYSILTSDPLTLLAIVFSGLIHDVDHRGVSNMQLSTEEPEMAVHYRNKSVAEQNSFDIAWNLLMQNEFDALRQAVFPTLPDLMRFRQVVVNTVLATDIFDKEMGDMRKARWNRVFGQEEEVLDEKTKNTRATIVLEHIIQASDVSHTMQHWHVYTKWNRRLFEEMHLAYQQGRMGKDPASFWYIGELGFFDNYVIPLARKLQECRVFGVSSDEYLQYAVSNRTEWEAKGKAIVEDMMKTIQQVSSTSSTTSRLSTSSRSNGDEEKKDDLREDIVFKEEIVFIDDIVFKEEDV